MKRNILLTIIALVFSGLTVFAQSDFDAEMIMLHKNAIKNCGMIKSKGNHNTVKILQSLGQLKVEIKADETKYTKNPPKDYADDPLFKSYFEELDDIVDALITRVKKENYKRATMNCARICMVFNKMHMFNGKMDLTDFMFSWKLQMTMTMNMLNAGNENGAYQNMGRVKSMYTKVMAFIQKKDNPEFHKNFTAVNNVYKKWSEAMSTKDKEKAQKLFAEFNKLFPKPFVQSL